MATYDGVHEHRPDVVVWSMRGLIGLSDPESVLRQVRSRLGARRTVVASDAVAGLVGALGRVGPGAVLAAGSGVVAFATDLEQVWRRVDGWGHVLADRGSGAWIGLAGPARRARDRGRRTRRLGRPARAGGAGVGAARASGRGWS